MFEKFSTPASSPRGDMTQQQRDFMDRNIQAATEAGCHDPVLVAGAAAAATGFGTTSDYITKNNPFGLRLYAHPVHGLWTVPPAVFNTEPGWSPVEKEAGIFETLADSYRKLKAQYECIQIGNAYKPATIIASYNQTLEG